MKKYKSKNNINLKSRQKLKRKRRYRKLFLLIVIVAIICGAGFIAKSFMNEDKTANSSNVNIPLNLNIGVAGIDTFNSTYSKNIHINQIGKIYMSKLLNVTSNYGIEYKLAKEVKKISNIEYQVILNEDLKWDDVSGITTTDVKYTIDNIKKSNIKNTYYDMVSNIKNVEVLDAHKLKIELNNPDELFIYSLNFPILKSGEYKTSDINTSAGNIGVYNAKKLDDNNLLLERSIQIIDNTVKVRPAFTTINVHNYKDLYEVIQKYRNNDIDLFMTEHADISNLMGRTEYNSKTYRNGNTKMILGNPNSILFSQKEIRQMMAYAINRDYIISNMNNVIAEPIDIPFLDSEIKYKYDKEEAKRALLDNGWRFEKSKWYKNINGEDKLLRLIFLVNKDDEQRMQISNYIKADLESIGIEVELLTLSSDEIVNRINSGNYDITLANLNLNTKPDIESIYNHIALNDNLKEKIISVYNSSADKYSENIKELQSSLSSEVAVVGIYSELSTLIYSKNLKGEVKPSYFNVFDMFTTWEK